MAKIPVILTFDKRIILAGAVAIKSLIDNAKETTEYDIYVYHPDIDDKTIKEYQKLVDGTRHSLTFEYISKERFAGAPINKGDVVARVEYYQGNTLLGSVDVLALKAVEKQQYHHALEKIFYQFINIY